MLTFPQFQATGREVDDLAAATGVEMDGEGPAPGVVYDGGLYICREGKSYALYLFQDAWQDEDRTPLERILWSAFYLSECVGEEEGRLSTGDGTLADFVHGWCVAEHGPTLDGSIIGRLMSHPGTYSVREVERILTEAAKPARALADENRRLHRIIATVASAVAGVA